MYQEIGLAVGKNEGVIRSMFEWLDANDGVVFSSVIRYLTKRYNMSPMSATYVYRCWQSSLG